MRGLGIETALRLGLISGAKDDRGRVGVKVRARVRFRVRVTIVVGVK